MQDPPEPRTSSLAGPVQDNPEGKFNIVQKPRGDQSTLQTAESTRSCPRNIKSNQSILQDPEHAVPIGQALPGADVNAKSALSYKYTTPPVCD